MITEHSTVVVADGLTAADLGGEAVVLDATTGRYFGLNTVGLRIFELSREPREVREIVQTLLEEFDVTEEQLRGDVLGFLRAMEKRELVRVEGAPAA